MNRRERDEKMLKIDKETHQKLKKWARELSVLEEKDISMKEIEKRIVNAPDISERLKIGSLERRKIGK